MALVPPLRHGQKGRIPACRSYVRPQGSAVPARTLRESRRSMSRHQRPASSSPTCLAVSVAWPEAYPTCTINCLLNPCIPSSSRYIQVSNCTALGRKPPRLARWSSRWERLPGTPAHHACLTISASGPTEMDCGPPRASSRPDRARSMSIRRMGRYIRKNSTGLSKRPRM